MPVYNILWPNKYHSKHLEITVSLRNTAAPANRFAPGAPTSTQHVSTKLANYLKIIKIKIIIIIIIIITITITITIIIIIITK